MLPSRLVYNIPLYILLRSSWWSAPIRQKKAPGQQFTDKGPPYTTILERCFFLDVICRTCHKIKKLFRSPLSSSSLLWNAIHFYGEGFWRRGPQLYCACFLIIPEPPLYSCPSRSPVSAQTIVNTILYTTGGIWYCGGVFGPYTCRMCHEEQTGGRRRRRHTKFMASLLAVKNQTKKANIVEV